MDEKIKQLKEKYCIKSPELLKRSFTPIENRADLRVLQWNTLAMALSLPQSDGTPLFKTENKTALDWRIRRVLVLEEIISRDADLIALQEVDDFEFYSKHLREIGYIGFFAPKADSPCINIKVYPA